MTPEFLSEEFNFDDPDLVPFIDEVPLWSAPFGISLLDKIKYRKNISAIDIGCGLGFPLTEVAMRLGNTSKVYGLDPWTAALNHLTKKLKVYDISNVELINGVAENINLPDDSIDLIVSNNGLNNVQDLQKSFKECQRIAREGCQFVATMNLDKTMIEFYSVFKEAVIEMNMPELITSIDNHIYEKRKPVEEIINLFEENNFRTKSETHSFNYRFADGTAMLNYFLIRFAFLSSWIKLLPHGKAANTFTFIEQKLNQVSEAEKGLSLSIPYIVVDADYVG